jgi:predicted TIM-barrel enzyme
VEKSLSIISNIIQAIFGKQKAIIGVVHCLPLPESPRNRDIDFKSTLQRALDDAGDAARALRCRAQIGAGNVAIFADAHVKHGAHAITANRSIAEFARDVEFFDADAIIATGQHTGDAASTDEIQAIRSDSSPPLLVGSSVTIENVETILPLANRIMLASALKNDGVWWNEIEKGRVSAFIRKAREIHARIEAHG